MESNVAEWRKLKAEIENNINLPQRPITLLMVSGGADSMWMLDFISNCDVDKFAVVHFNHGIRSDEETTLDYSIVFTKVKQINEERNRLGRPVINMHYRTGKGLRDIPNQEAECHNQRWAFVEDVLLQYPKHHLVLPFVITGHHRNDAIESTFLNLIRGKDHDKLSLKPRSFFKTHIRWKPFLNVTKDEILEQCQKRGIHFHEDSTNVDIKNDRNWIRHVIIPQLEQRRNLTTSMASALTESCRRNY